MQNGLFKSGLEAGSSQHQVETKNNVSVFCVTEDVTVKFFTINVPQAHSPLVILRNKFNPSQHGILQISPKIRESWPIT